MAYLPSNLAVADGWIWCFASHDEDTRRVKEVVLHVDTVRSAFMSNDVCSESTGAEVDEMK